MSRKQTVYGRAAETDLDLKTEIKYNILLLLRNRYPQGVDARILTDEYKKFFNKDINTRIFNPKATNLYQENREFLGDDIEVVSMNNKSFIRANQGCSENMMLLISSASSYQKVHKNENYVYVKNESYNKSSYNNEEYNGYFIKPEGRDSDSEPDVIPPSDPLRHINPDSAINLSTGIHPNFASTSATAGGHYLETIQRVGSDSTQYSVPAGAPALNYMVSNASGSQFAVGPNSAPYYIVNYPGNPIIVDNSQISHTTPTTPQPQVTPAPSSAPSNSPVKKKKKKDNPARLAMDKNGYYRCPFEGCKKSFRRYKILENHQRLTHRNAGDGNGFACSTVGCGEKFGDKSSLQHHESRCLLKPHCCKWTGCEKRFRTSKLLHGHISAVHRKVGRNTFKCSVPGCLQAYPDTTKLKIHENRCRFKFDYDNEPGRGEGENGNLVHMDPNSNKSPLLTNDDKMKTAVSQFLNKFEADLNVPVFFDATF